MDNPNEQEVKVSSEKIDEKKSKINYTRTVGNSEIKMSEIVNTDDDINGFF